MTPASRLLAPLLAAAVVACGARERLEVELPEDFLSDAATLLVALESEAKILQVGIARPGSARSTLEDVLPERVDYASEPLELTVAKTTREISQLGLEEGVLVEPPSGSVTQRVLPLFQTPRGVGPLELQKASIRGTEVSAFAPGVPSERLAQVTSAIDSRCAPPHLSVLHGSSEIGVDIRTVGLVPDGRMMYGGARLERIDGKWVRMGVVGHITRTDTGLEVGSPTDIAGTRQLYSFEWRQDSFFSYDTNHQFLELSADGELVRTLTPTSAGHHGVDVGADGVVLTWSESTGVVSELVDGSTIAVPLPDFPPGVRALSLETRDIVIVFAADWTAGDPATGTFSHGALWLCDRVGCERSLDVEGPVLAWPTVHAGPDGYAALLNSDVVIHRDGAWETFTGLSLESSTIPKNGIAPVRDGYLVVGDVGYANLYLPDEGWCDNEHARRIVGRNRNLPRLGSNRELAGIAVASDGAAIRWLPVDPLHPEAERDFEIGDGSVVTLFESSVAD